MVDFSHQEPGQRKGNHAQTLDVRTFRVFLLAARGTNCDVMLEIKDKEASALRAVALVRKEKNNGDVNNPGWHGQVFLPV